MSSRFKKLPLYSPFTYEKEWWEDCVKEENRITPVFNSNGYYLDRYSGKTWLEINGEAWLYGSRNSWQYQLDIHEMNPWYSPELMLGIKLVIDAGLASKELKKKYCLMRDRIMIRETYLNSRLRCYETMRRLGVKKYNKIALEIKLKRKMK